MTDIDIDSILHLIIYIVRHKNKKMQDRKAVNKLYQSQNISIRKTIRELDMGYDNLLSSDTNEQSIKRPDVNILVVGPQGSGKTSLLKTMHYALNSNLSCYVQNRMVWNTCFDRYEIKRNKRCVVEGLSKLKETDEKLGVNGFEINFNMMGNQFNNPVNRYSRCMEFIGNKTLGCIQYNNTNFTGINYVIICISMIDNVKKQELMALKLFITQLQEMRIKFNIVGTHLDLITDKNPINNHNRPSMNASYATYASYSSMGTKNEEQRIIYIDQWKKKLYYELGLKNYVEIYCMENYGNVCKKQGFENSESVNFYALTLLNNCIRRAPQTEKYKKNGYKLFCF